MFLLFLKNCDEFLKIQSITMNELESKLKMCVANISHCDISYISFINMYKYYRKAKLNTYLFSWTYSEISKGQRS